MKSFFYSIMLLMLVLFVLVKIGSTSKGFVTYDELGGKSYSVTYNNRSLLINGSPSLFISGSVHPPRSTVATWDKIFQTAKENGLNMIELYVFWNYHEPLEGHFNWEGSGDLALFVQKCASHGLFVNLRIGPYVCAEWTYGGIPVWLGFKEGIQFRAYNQVWMQYMERWFTQVVKLLAPYFPQNGGPIILVQVENELHTSGTQGELYVEWCGKMAATALQSTPVPILMCNGNSASNTINTCNNDDCTSFIESHGQNQRVLVDQPALWTENEGGFQVWGESPSKVTTYFWGRSTENLSYKVLQWFARGGSHNNYYMYFGGNNFGVWAGASVTAMYASDANMCPDTFPHEPKFSHLGRAHALVAQYADVIAYDVAQLGKEIHLQWFNNETGKFQDGTQQIAFVYKLSTSTRSVVFIENQASVTVLTLYNGKTFNLLPYSCSIVDGEALKELYNSATVLPPDTHRVDTPYPSDTPFSWKIWKEPFYPAPTQFPVVRSTSPLEQSGITMGLTDYMWYHRIFSYQSSTSSPVLSFYGTTANGFLVFVDGKFVANKDDHGHDSEVPILYEFNVGTLSLGEHTLDILSESFGFSNGMGVDSTRKYKGITGAVTIGTTNLTEGDWTMRPYLAGELLQVYTDKGSQNVSWSSDLSGAGAVTWYQTEITLSTLPCSSCAILLDAIGLDRGRAFINGFDIGRYWTILMNDNSGKPTQRLYHVPIELFVVGRNVLTLIEIEGVQDHTKPRFVLRKIAPSSLRYSGSYSSLKDSGIQSCPL